MRFTSAAVVAVNNGLNIIPARNAVEAEMLLKTVPNVRFSSGGSSAISPQSFIGKHTGEIILDSPNGATIACHAAGMKNVFLGALLNASAAANVAVNAAKSARCGVTIIASGEHGGSREAMMPEFERRLSKGNPIFCFEDYVAAGAISFKIAAEKDETLYAAETVYRQNSDKLVALFPQIASGQQLIARGFAEDVDFCSNCDMFQVTPTVSKRCNVTIICLGP